MVSLRCKKVISTLVLFINIIVLWSSLSIDEQNTEFENTDIPLILSFLLLPVSIITTIYFCGVSNNVNAVANFE